MLQYFDNRGCRGSLSSESVTSFLVDRKDSLIKLLLDGERISADCFSHLSMVKNLRLLDVTYADFLSTQGLAAISDLTNLQSLRVYEHGVADISRADLLLAFSKPSWSSITRFRFKTLPKSYPACQDKLLLSLHLFAPPPPPLYSRYLLGLTLNSSFKCFLLLLSYSL